MTPNSESSSSDSSVPDSLEPVPDSLDYFVGKVAKSRIGRVASRVESSRVPFASSAGRVFLHAQYGFYFPGELQEKFCESFQYYSLRLTALSLIEGAFLNGVRGALCLIGSSEHV